MVYNLGYVVQYEALKGGFWDGTPLKIEISESAAFEQKYA